MSTADVALVHRVLDWFNLDEPMPLDLFAEDHEWTPSITGGDTTVGGTYFGVEGWEAYRREARDTWAALKPEPVTVTDLGGGVVTAESVLRATGLASHASVAMTVYFVCVVRGDRLALTRSFQRAEDARRYADELLGA